VFVICCIAKPDLMSFVLFCALCLIGIRLAHSQTFNFTDHDLYGGLYTPPTPPHPQTSLADGTTWCKPWFNYPVTEQRCHDATQAGLAQERAEGQFDQQPAQTIYTIMPRTDGSVDIIQR
jgi:hypothetical protein